MSFNHLQALMQTLRSKEGGCAWSLEQTFASLVPHTQEEVYELIEAIESENPQAILQELADLLLQIGFYSQIAQEQGLFTLTDVEATCIAKQQQRKPQLQSKEKISSTQASTIWETIKAQERAQQKDTFADICKTLPALTYAKKIQQRAALLGFDWQQLAPVIAKCDEELHELKQAIAQQEQHAIAQELGDLLFSCVNLARHLQIDPEQALRAAKKKFKKRLRQVQTLAAEDSLELEKLSLSELTRLWDIAKTNTT